MEKRMTGFSIANFSIGDIEQQLRRGQSIDDTAAYARKVFDTAEQLAPLPDSRDATAMVWARHYAVLGLAAHAACRHAYAATIPRQPVPGSRPDVGYLGMVAASATAAAVALVKDHRAAPSTLWDLTPELGAFNDECVNWLAAFLDQQGVNPADLYPWFDAGDFDSPSRTTAATSAP